MKMINGIKCDAYQSVEVALPGLPNPGQTGSQWTFPDLPYLRPRMAWIQAIGFYTIGSVTNGPVSGTALVTTAIAQKSTLTLYGTVPNVKQGNQIIQQLPLVQMNTLQNSATDPFAQNIFLLNDMEVDWTKSYIQIANAPANTTNMVFAFGIYFNFHPGSLMNQ